MALSLSLSVEMFGDMYCISFLGGEGWRCPVLLSSWRSLEMIWLELFNSDSVATQQT